MDLDFDGAGKSKSQGLVGADGAGRRFNSLLKNYYFFSHVKTLNTVRQKKTHTLQPPSLELDQPDPVMKTAPVFFPTPPLEVTVGIPSPTASCVEVLPTQPTRSRWKLPPPRPPALMPSPPLPPRPWWYQLPSHPSRSQWDQHYPLPPSMRPPPPNPTRSRWNRPHHQFTPLRPSPPLLSRSWWGHQKLYLTSLQ